MINLSTPTPHLATPPSLPLTSPISSHQPLLPPPIASHTFFNLNLKKKNLYICLRGEKMWVSSKKHVFITFLKTPLNT